MVNRSDSAEGPARLPALLAVVAAALAAAFVLAPPALVRSSSGAGFDDQRHLVEALRPAFAEYWRSGGRDLSPGMADVVDYWFRYHLVKALIAAIVLAVLGALSVLLWKAFLRSGTAAGRAGLASAGVLVTILTLFSTAVLMANVQGMVAPFASLFPLLTDGPGAGTPPGTLEEVRQSLAGSLGGTGGTPPALDVMISDFARYHEAMAVVAAVVTAVLGGLSVLLWRRFAATRRSERRTRRLLGAYGVGSVVMPLVVAVVVVANTTTAAHPAPALLAFFEGGW
ncbi:hypothetical protein AB0J80_29460 [Actinoplanes sp. NPDC049548]|uniref:hypothetical protein n=1 Tax=Actinoplanes sp. NPDC049548 TaxID=3155152 RepID=UPI003446D877